MTSWEEQFGPIDDITIINAVLYWFHRGSPIILQSSGLIVSQFTT